MLQPRPLKIIAHPEDLAELGEAAELIAQECGQRPVMVEDPASARLSARLVWDDGSADWSMHELEEIMLEYLKTHNENRGDND
jgi:hypothetical protein